MVTARVKVRGKAIQKCLLNCTPGPDEHDDAPAALVAGDPEVPPLVDGEGQAQDEADHVDGGESSVVTFMFDVHKIYGSLSVLTQSATHNLGLPFQAFSASTCRVTIRVGENLQLTEIWDVPLS